jgi:prepilin-type N-terminal cleavage/methylation domain-containing protein
MGGFAMSGELPIAHCPLPIEQRRPVLVGRHVARPPSGVEYAQQTQPRVRLRRMLHDGFTLLEMIVATAIVAMLAASLYASLHIAFNARKSALSAVEGARKGCLAMEIIKADLRSAVVPQAAPAGAAGVATVTGGGFSGQGGTTALPGGPMATQFTGVSAKDTGVGGDTLTFFAVAMDAEPAVGAGDVKGIQYSCETIPGTTGLSLIRRVTDNPLAPAAKEPKQEILCHGVRDFTLSYSDGTTWADSWDSASLNNTLPTAVEVTITLDDGSGGAGVPMTAFVLLPCGQSADVTAAAAAAATAGASSGGGSTGGKTGGTSGGTKTPAATPSGGTTGGGTTGGRTRGTGG